MAFEYRYSVYNPGQYHQDVQDQWDELVDTGWQVHTAAPNYNEIGILWHREIPEAELEERRKGRREDVSDSPPLADGA